MFRYLRELLSRFWRGVCYAFSECWALLSAPFRNMGPGQLRAKLARDRADLGASSQMIFLETSKTATGVFQVITRSPFSFGRWLIEVPGRVWRFLRSRTYLQLFGLAMIAAISVTAVVAPAWIVIRHRQLTKVLNRYQQKLEADFAHCDFDGVKGDLQMLLEVRPDDRVIANRLKAFETGVADPDDPKMARLLMANHRGLGRMDEAVREAKKYIEFESKDWTALIILAEHSMAKGDTAAASKWVSQLPSTSEATNLNSMWTCSVATGILQQLGDERRLDDLTEFVTKHYVPLLPKPIVAASDPVSKMQLFEMYVLALRLLAQKPELLESWDAAQRLVDSVLVVKEIPAGILIRFGLQLEIQRETHLNTIDQLKLVSPAKSAEMANQLEERLSSIWTRVRASEPKKSISYSGVASQLLRAKDLPGALAQLELGLQAAGPTPDLIEKKADVLRQIKPAEAVQFLDAALGGPPKTPSQCRVLAMAALANGDTDRARDAVKRAQAMLPDAPWLTVLEAQVELQANRPTDATLVLRKVLHLIPRDPNASRLYVRAQCECGAVVLAEQFLNDLMDHHSGSSPAVLMGCVGLIESKQIGTAIRVLRRLTHREPLNLAATIALAECLYIQAEYRPTGWTRAELDEAMAAYRGGLRKFPDQLEFVSRIAWLELIALDSPRQANNTAAPLRTAKDLPPDALRTVGAVYAYNGEYENARNSLEKSLERSGPNAGTLALLALAQHGLNKPTESKDALDKAKAIEKPTPREVELRDSIEKKIQRGSRS